MRINANGNASFQYVYLHVDFKSIQEFVEKIDQLAMEFTIFAIFPTLRSLFHAFFFHVV